MGSSERGRRGWRGRAGGHLQQLSMWQVAGSLRQRVHVKCVFQPTFSPLFPTPSPSPSRRLALWKKKSRTLEEASCGTAKLVALHARRAPRSIAPSRSLRHAHRPVPHPVIMNRMRSIQRRTAVLTFRLVRECA
ncbi:hypothetical protein L1887_56462 [Cichorium endivia]|nr:hypothetical protein L1887_56462 [Cichorium endivia]